MTLAKSGYFGGNPCTIWNAPLDVVLHTYYYEIYTRDYENTCLELNKKESK